MNLIAAGLALLASAWAYSFFQAGQPLPFPAQNFGISDLEATNLPLTPASLEGVYASNTLLRRAHVLFKGQIEAAETLAISPDGNLTLLDKYGYLRHAVPTGQPFPAEWRLVEQPVAYLGPGRPLGVQYDAAGNLVVADAVKGLLLLERDGGRLVSLTAAVSPSPEHPAGSPFSFANDLEVASDGSIYFTESQAIPASVYPGGAVGARPYISIFHAFLYGMLSGSPTGRLLRYDPATRTTQQLAAGLWYANGVALAADESYVAVVDSCRARVVRHWLKGPKAGSTDVLIENLPGFPDGIDRAPDGNFWVALVAPVGPLPHALKFKALRVLLAYLPDWARPPLDHWGAAVKVSPEGKPLQFLMDPQGEKIAFVSSVLETEDRIYFGNVQLDYVSVLDKADLPPAQA
ncbi:hypothetical protein HXX76_002527 [Chlamydomonas incerta]|uniref:Strictosidine synthase conserved region domain-containing protein n=1 Tax=Chlamydomonas incerta TaxID=51695 RepID=A0A835TE74_CHLIN|nr:hypothetical protein HXX76_002527 [Chlamydomonas incerta]|eukprot:KAG2442441.1 hypothetical protein HXX76_002527 [Chlamydomonas incerta]